MVIAVARHQRATPRIAAPCLTGGPHKAPHAAWLALLDTMAGAEAATGCESL